MSLSDTIADRFHVQPAPVITPQDIELRIGDAGQSGPTVRIVSLRIPFEDILRLTLQFLGAALLVGLVVGTVVSIIWAVVRQ